MTTTTETKFQVGDKVTVTNPDMSQYGKTGEVVLLKSGTTPWPIHVKFDHGYDASYAAEELELVTPPFTFADIQVGDTIRRTQTFKGGSTEVREGTVEHVKSWYVASEGDDFILAYDTDDKEGVTLELLNRPEPEPVKADWETAKAGDRIVVTGKKGTTRVLTKQEDGLWDCLIIRSYGNRNGIKRDDAEVAKALTGTDFSKDGTYSFHPAS